MAAGRAARGDWKSVVNGCQGASWSEELDGKELRGALGGERDLESRGSPFSGHRLLILLHLLQYSMLIFKCSPCTVVMQNDCTSYDSVISLVNCSVYVHSAFCF